jgi:hypothetical protein
MKAATEETQAPASLGDWVAELLEALGELLAALVRATGQHSQDTANRVGPRHLQTIGWLRPLIIASVSLENAVRRLPVLDTATVATRCEALARLLTAPPHHAGDDFTARYARECALSPLVAALHRRVVAACRRIANPT